MLRVKSCCLAIGAWWYYGGEEKITLTISRFFWISGFFGSWILIIGFCTPIIKIIFRLPPSFWFGLPQWLRWY